MKHIEGDVVKPRDCIVLASGHRKRDLPFIAKVTSLWENPEDGKLLELMFYPSTLLKWEIHGVTINKVYTFNFQGKCA